MSVAGTLLTARNRCALLVPVILAPLLIAGGLIPLVGTWGYNQISWFIPAQWGFAAATEGKQ